MFNTLIVQPFGWILKFSYDLVGSYGLAIVVFTIISKLILLPFQMKSKKSMMEMNRLQPQLKELERKYKNDKDRYSLEVQKLYKKEGVSCFGGCLPLLITLPIMIGLYNVVRQPLTYIFGITGDQLSQIANALNDAGVKGLADAAARGDYMLEISIASHLRTHGEIITNIASELKGVDFMFLGIDLTAIPNGKLINVLWIVPLLSGITSWLSSWLMRRTQPAPATEQAAASNSVMNVMMPLMSVFIAFMVPTGLGFYWIISNILTAIQEPLLTMYYKKKAEAKELEGEQ